MKVADASRKYSYLYHMASPGALGLIQKHGLLCASALTELFEVDVAERQQLCEVRRAETVKLVHPVHGTAFLRDQKPIYEKCLERCLQDGLKPADWYRILNQRVFLWADPKRLVGLRQAGSYRGGAQLILTIDAARFVEAYYERIEVATFNTGSATRKAKERGLATFVPLRDFAGKEKIVEVTVVGGIPDIAKYLSVGHPPCVVE